MMMKQRKSTLILTILVVFFSAVAITTVCEVKKAHRMKVALETALEQNRNFIPFTSDTIYPSPSHDLSLSPTKGVSLHDVVAYYNHPLRRHIHLPLWGNLRGLSAYYVLGCVCRDLHEAPIALLTWEEAIAAYSSEKDRREGAATLCRIYGQMAEVYYRQCMPEKQLEAQQKCSDYALMAGDTLNYIRCMLPKNDAYLSMGDTAAVFENIKHVRQLYLERGLKQEAAQVYPSAIQIALDRGEYVKADSMMRIFEKESGLFDEQGNIEATREIYYYDKGCYFAGIGLLDSAEIQFRRLLNHEPNIVDAYRGLVSLYLRKENRDSLRKYTKLYEDAIANYLEETQTQAIVQAEGMYDYSRQQRMAAAQKRKADILVLTGLLFVLFFIATIAYIVRRYKKANEQERKRHMEVRAQYGDAIQKLAQVRREIGILQRNTSDKENALDSLTQEKKELAQLYEKEIERLTSELASYKETQDEVERKAAIISHFHTIAKPHLENDEKGLSRRVGAREASEEEWNQLIETVRLCYPRFYVHLMEHSLSDLRLHVCILSRLGFENKDIVTLVKSSIQSVSNVRTTLAKVFGLTSTKDLNDYLKNF